MAQGSCHRGALFVFNDGAQDVFWSLRVVVAAGSERKREKEREREREKERERQKERVCVYLFIYARSSYSA